MLAGTHNLLGGYERPVKVCKGIVKDCPSFAQNVERQGRPERAAEAGVPGVGAVGLFRWQVLAEVTTIQFHGLEDYSSASTAVDEERSTPEP